MLGITEMFMVFFVTLGPLKAVGPFAQRTRALDETVARRLAFWAFVLATAGILAGGFLGRTLLTNWNVSVPAMTLTAGIVLFLVAIRQLMEQYDPHAVTPPETLPAAPIAAASKLVFPIVLTPYGIAAVIALVASSDSMYRTLTIFGLVLVVMVLNLIALWYVRRIVTGFTLIILQIVGAILAVLQVALSVQVVLRGLRDLEVLV
jgi:multiple antibiotic resistance protein